MEIRGINWVKMAGIGLILLGGLVMLFSEKLSVPTR